MTATYLTLPELSARFSDLDQYPEESLQAALDDANGIAAGYVLALYPVLTTVPVLLKSAVADVARRKLYKFEAPDGVVQAYEEAMKLLRDVAAGRIVFPAPPPAEGELLDEGLIFSGSTVRQFTRSKLLGL